MKKVKMLFKDAPAGPFTIAEDGIGFIKLIRILDGYNAVLVTGGFARLLDSCVVMVEQNPICWSEIPSGARFTIGDNPTIFMKIENSLTGSCFAVDLLTGEYPCAAPQVEEYYLPQCWPKVESKP